jgi:Cu/Ag efflux protein CusF
MRTRRNKTIWAAAVCIALGIGGCSASKEAPPPAAPAAPAPLPGGVVDAGLVTATATVKAIDQKTRHVTLQRADGSLIKFRADDKVRNLAQVKVGDVVAVSYYESLAYQVKKPGTAAPGAVVAGDVERAKLGEKPGAAGAVTTTITATIAAIDKAAGTVTLKGPDGDLNTIKVRNPSNLDRVTVGDLVEITYTEAVAVSVDSPAKK